MSFRDYTDELDPVHDPDEVVRSHVDDDYADHFFRRGQGTVASLAGLFQEGDLIITRNKNEVFLDLTVRRSGITLQATGDTLPDAIDEAYARMEEHINALDHFEDLGIDPEDLGRLAAFERDDYDQLFAPIAPPAPAPVGPAFIPPTSTGAPVMAAAGEPLDERGEGYVWALLIPVRLGRA